MHTYPSLSLGSPEKNSRPNVIGLCVSIIKLIKLHLLRQISLIYLDNIPILRSFCYRSFNVLYADDILLIATSVSELQELFDAYVIELSWLDINIHEKILLYPH